MKEKEKKKKREESRSSEETLCIEFILLLRLCGKNSDLVEGLVLSCSPAPGIVAESPQESASALSEDLERKARFFSVWEFAGQIPKPKKRRPKFLLFYSHAWISRGQEQVGDENSA
jgi:hypothetical protein